jgi:YHS domain-containing protein
MALDPICGREVNEDSWSLEYADTTYWFCSQACRDDFRRAPRMLIAVGPRAAA